MNNLVYLHSQAVNVGAADVAPAKSMYFTSPALAGITRGCGSDFAAAGTKIKDGVVKQVRLGLSSACAWDGTACGQEFLPAVVADYNGPAMSAGVGKLVSVVFGEDSVSVRDKLGIVYSDFGGQSFNNILMYQSFPAAASVAALDLAADPSAPKLAVNVSPVKAVAAGDFKFTYALQLKKTFSFFAGATHVRVVFSLAALNFVAATDTATFTNDAATGNLKTATFYAVAADDASVDATFSLDFSGTFQYGAWDVAATTNGFSGAAMAAVVTLSDDKASVYVDMPITAALKAALAASADDFLILYDPELKASENGVKKVTEDSSGFPLVLVIVGLVMVCVAGVAVGAAVHVKNKKNKKPEVVEMVRA
jgi:hypothetical protein